MNPWPTWRIIIDLSNSRPAHHKLLIICDGENEMQRKAHHAHSYGPWKDNQRYRQRERKRGRKRQTIIEKEKERVTFNSKFFVGGIPVRLLLEKRSQSNSGRSRRQVRSTETVLRAVQDRLRSVQDSLSGAQSMGERSAC